jgi:hypothetical protein
VLGQHDRADHLGIEGQQHGAPVQVGDPAADPRGGGRDHVVHRAEPFAESGDGGLVGQVHDLGADAGLACVGRGQGFLVTAGRHDMRSGVHGGQGNRAGQAAAPPDDQDGLILQ